MLLVQKEFTKQLLVKKKTLNNLGSQKMSLWKLRAEKMLGYETAFLKSSNQKVNVWRNGLLLCVQFVFTTLNNSLLFLVALRELSRELRVINYNLRKILGMTKINYSGERGLAVVPWRLISSGVRMGEKRDLQYIVRLFHATIENNQRYRSNLLRSHTSREKRLILSRTLS